MKYQLYTYGEVLYIAQSGCFSLIIFIFIFFATCCVSSPHSQLSTTHQQELEELLGKKTQDEEPTQQLSRSFCWVLCCWTAQGWKARATWGVFFLLDVIFSKEPVKFLPPRHTTSSIRARWCRKCTFFDKRAILWDDEHPRNRPLQEGLKFSLKITPIFHLIFKRRWRSEVLIIDVNRKLGAGFHWGTLKFYTKHWGWFKIWLAQHSFPILSCEKARNSIVENMMYICYTFIYLQDAFLLFLQWHGTVTCLSSTPLKTVPLFLQESEQLAKERQEVETECEEVRLTGCNPPLKIFTNVPQKSSSSNHQFSWEIVHKMLTFWSHLMLLMCCWRMQWWLPWISMGNGKVISHHTSGCYGKSIAHKVSF